MKENNSSNQEDSRLKQKGHAASDDNPFHKSNIFGEAESPAEVLDKGRIYGSAEVLEGVTYPPAEVLDKGRIYGSAEVLDKGRIYASAEVLEGVTYPPAEVLDKGRIGNIGNDNKYRLDETDSMNVDGHTLYRIVALKDFADVKAGDKGGYIESEDNLSHDGAAWVYDNAQVFDKAKVSDNAQVKDNAHVHGYTQVAGNARISGYGELNVNDTITEDVALDFGRNASASESESLSVEESRRKGLGI